MVNLKNRYMKKLRNLHVNSIENPSTITASAYLAEDQKQDANGEVKLIFFNQKGNPTFFYRSGGKCVLERLGDRTELMVKTTNPLDHSKDSTNSIVLVEVSKLTIRTAEFGVVATGSARRPDLKLMERSLWKTHYSMDKEFNIKIAGLNNEELEEELAAVIDKMEKVGEVDPPLKIDGEFRLFKGHNLAKGRVKGRDAIMVKDVNFLHGYALGEDSRGKTVMLQLSQFGFEDHKKALGLTGGAILFARNFNRGKSGGFCDLIAHGITFPKPRKVEPRKDAVPAAKEVKASEAVKPKSDFADKLTKAVAKVEVAPKKVKTKGDTPKVVKVVKEAASTKKEEPKA
jgi:hypothetical protein